MNRRGILKLMGIRAASLAATASLPSLARVAGPESPRAARVDGPFESCQVIFVISSRHQDHDLAIRVLLPAKLEKIASPGVLYVLPTEPEIQFRVGDGLTTVERLDLHNKFGLIAVQPSFSDWPWYANHPTDPKMQQETYFLEDVVPFIDSVYPNPSKKRLLVGFSKSGNGAYQLLLRHPEVFLAASVWDPPLMYKSPSEFEMPQVYGDQANFDKYCIPQLLTKQAKLLRGKPPRLGLFGYGSFGGPHPKYGPHIEEAHALMERLRIPHIYDDSVQREHRWESGWLEPAVAALAAMSRSHI
jgi:hypothetical protein